MPDMHAREEMIMDSNSPAAPRMRHAHLVSVSALRVGGGIKRDVWHSAQRRFIAKSLAIHIALAAICEEQLVLCVGVLKGNLQLLMHYEAPAASWCSWEPPSQITRQLGRLGPLGVAACIQQPVDGASRQVVEWLKALGDGAQIDVFRDSERGIATFKHLS